MKIKALRDELYTQFKLLVGKKIDPETASAISKMSDSILRTITTEISLREKAKKLGFTSEDQQQLTSLINSEPEEQIEEQIKVRGCER